MSKKVFWIAFAAISAGATLFHFLYDITQFPPFMVIAPINESVFEHSKILVYPFLIFATIYYFILKPQNKLAFWAATARATLTMQVLMIAIFYTYSGILGKNYLTLDILLTYVCVFFGLVVFDKSLKQEIKYEIMWVVILALQIALITVFTFWQPNLPLFESV